MVAPTSPPGGGGGPTPPPGPKGPWDALRGFYGNALAFAGPAIAMNYGVKQITDMELHGGAWGYGSHPGQGMFPHINLPSNPTARGESWKWGLAHGWMGELGVGASMLLDQFGVSGRSNLQMETAKEAEKLTELKAQQRRAEVAARAAGDVPRWAFQREQEAGTAQYGGGEEGSGWSMRQTRARLGLEVGGYRGIAAAQDAVRAHLGYSTGQQREDVAARMSYDVNLSRQKLETEQQVQRLRRERDPMLAQLTQRQEEYQRAAGAVKEKRSRFEALKTKRERGGQTTEERSEEQRLMVEIPGVDAAREQALKNVQGLQNQITDSVKAELAAKEQLMKTSAQMGRGGAKETAKHRSRRENENDSPGCGTGGQVADAADYARKAERENQERPAANRV